MPGRETSLWRSPSPGQDVLHRAQTPYSRAVEAEEHDASEFGHGEPARGFGGESLRQHASLLGDPRLSHSANAAPRRAIAQALQRQRGNGYVRTLVKHLSPVNPGAFQPKLTDTGASTAQPPEAQVVQREFAKVNDEPGVNLDTEEASGGHTLERHVGKENDYITGRIVESGIDVASTYPDKATAQATVNASLNANKTDANQFIFDPTIGPNATKALRHTASGDIGGYLADSNVQDAKGRAKKKKALKKTKKSVAVLRKTATGAYLLTSFPEP